MTGHEKKRIHLDRIARRHRHHRGSGWAAIAGAGPGERQSPSDWLPHFIDEHEHSIDNARFALAGREEWRWIDFPATRHDNGCVLSFADGHSEMWRWLEPNTIRIGRMKPWIQGQSGVPGTDRDLRRIHESMPRAPIQ